MSPTSQLAAPRPGVAARKRTKQEQVRLYLLSEIAVGNLRPGDALPAEPQLAEMMGVSRSTIRQTLGDMEREGKILRRQGKGTFIAGESQTDLATEAKTKAVTSLAIIVPDVASSYYASLLSAFEQATHETGRSAVVCSSNNNVDRQASQILRLLDQGAAGVVLNPSSLGTTPACQVQILQKAGIPVALLHRSIEGVSAPLLRLCGEEIGCRAAQLLCEAGHRRVAFLTTGAGEAVAQYETGFRDGLQQWNVELPESHVVHGDLALFSTADRAERERRVTAAVETLMHLPDRPTAIYVSFDTVAEYVYLTLQRLGLRVPEDVSLVTFGSSHREGALRQALTSLTVDEKAAIQRAVKVIVEMQQGKRPLQDNEEFLLPVECWPGATLAVRS